jgi:parallel beta-helix repeat protein
VPISTLEFIMNQWFGKLLGLSRPQVCVRKQRSRARLSMEVLEDRSVPSANVFVVTNAGDPLGTHQGVTLRDAVKSVNADKTDSATTPDTIQFDIAGSGVQVISLNKALPAIARSVIIDGTTEPGYSGTPLIALTPANASVKGDGIDVTHGNATIKGLAVYGFSGFGLNITGAKDTITADYVGVEADGVTASANGLSGIYLHSANNSVISASTFGDNDHRGIRVDSSAHVTIGGATASAGNTISTNGVAGSAEDPNYAGIVIKDGSWDVTIANNTISGNGRGIRISNAGAKLPTGATFSIVIESNTISGSATQGILIDNHFGGPAKNVQVSNDTIENCTGDGAMVDNSTNIAFTNDTITGNGKHGILVGAGVKTVTLNSNTIANNTDSGVEIDT